MLKYWFLAGTLFIAADSSSQVRHRHNFRIEGFSLKTDLFSTFEGLLEKHSKSFNLSGEMYFNEEFSLNADVGIETATSPGFNRTVTTSGGHFRWYFNQDDCNCSSFFTGIYFTMIHDNQTVDHQLTLSDEVTRNQSILEGGLTGGFQALINRHLVIDPALQIGKHFPVHYSSAERPKPWTKDNSIQLRILLGIGYRF